MPTPILQPFQRLYSGPVEKSEIFDSLEAAEAYAAGGASYEGQEIKVRGSAGVTHYEVAGNKTLTPQSGGTGEPGPKGDKGDKGDTGPQGPKGDPGSGMSPLASYVTAALPTYIRKVQRDIRPDSVVMTVITDTHAEADVSDDRMQGMYAFAEITKALGPTFCTHLGDILADPISVTTTDKYLSWMAQIVKALEGVSSPTFVLNGNHDIGLYRSNVLGAYVTPQQFTAAAQQPFDDGTIVRNGKNNGTKQRPYGYRDFASKKLRVVFLDSCDVPLYPGASGGFEQYELYGWQNDQLGWLGEALDLTGKTDWGVIILSHIPPAGALMPGMTLNNDNLMKGIVEACIDATTFSGSATGNYSEIVSVDFTGKPKPKYVLWCNGHTHIDCVTMPAAYTKFKAVAFLCGVPIPNTGTLPTGGVSPSPRTAGTLSALAVTTCVYHPETGELKTFRFGAGADYTVQLHAAPVKATSLAVGGATAGARAVAPFGAGMTLSAFKEISIKFKAASAATSPRYILQSFQASGGMFDVQYYNGKLRYYFLDGLTTGTQTISQGTVYTLRIAISVSGGNTTVTTYITPDGGSETQDATVTKATFTLGGNFNMLRSSGDSSAYLIGEMYRVKFTAADSSTYADYVFDEGTDIISDASGNGRNLILTGVYNWLYA